MPPRLLVTGSRDWTDHSSVEEALKDWWLSTDRNPDAVLVSGGCPTGADRIAETLWENQGLIVERHPADWKNLGRGAGPVRNKKMVSSNPDAAVAFIRGGSKGASGTLSMVRRAGIAVRVYEDEPRTSSYPLKLVRPCCVEKTDCGTTELYLVELPGDEPSFEYRRVSNGDKYFGPAGSAETDEFISI